MGTSFGMRIRGCLREFRLFRRAATSITTPHPRGRATMTGRKKRPAVSDSEQRSERVVTKETPKPRPKSSTRRAKAKAQPKAEPKAKAELTSKAEPKPKGQPKAVARPQPVDATLAAAAEPKGRPKKRKVYDLKGAQFEEAAKKATERALKDLSEKYDYPGELLGTLSCEYTGYDTAKECIDNHTDVSFAWTYRHASTERGLFEVKQQISLPAGRLFQRDKHLVLPREIVTAAFVVAAFEKMPEHHRRFPCFVRNARHALGHASVVKILAIGAAKNTTALPERTQLVENELGDEKEYMLVANISGDL